MALRSMIKLPLALLRNRAAPLAVNSRFFSTAEAVVNEDVLTSERKSGRRRERPPPITLTDGAVLRIKELLKHQDDKIGIKLGVRRRGCNGLSYTMNYASEKPKNHEEVSKDGVHVFIEPMALFHIVGTTMDFEETELSAEFTFKNPNAKGECGCGESFNT